MVNDEQTEVTDISIEVRSVASMRVEHLTQIRVFRFLGMAVVSLAWLASCFLSIGRPAVGGHVLQSFPGRCVAVGLGLVSRQPRRLAW